MHLAGKFEFHLDLGIVNDSICMWSFAWPRMLLGSTLKCNKIYGSKLLLLTRIGFGTLFNLCYGSPPLFIFLFFKCYKETGQLANPKETLGLEYTRRLKLPWNLQIWKTWNAVHSLKKRVRKYRECKNIFLLTGMMNISVRICVFINLRRRRILSLMS